MIALVDDAAKESAFLALCDADDVFGPDLHTRYRMSRSGAGDSLFWLAIDGAENPAAALGRSDGQITIAVRARTDADELGQFLRMAGGFGQIRAKTSVCADLLPLLGGKFFDGPVMRYPGGIFPGRFDMISYDPPLDALYGLLCAACDDFLHVDRARWHVFHSHLFRHGFGFATGVSIGGKLIASGGVYAQNASYALIASVATDPAFRGGGYGQSIVRSLCNRIIKDGKTPVLHCAQERLTRYYEPLGFALSGRWGRIDL